MKCDEHDILKVSVGGGGEKGGGLRGEAGGSTVKRKLQSAGSGL